eukprot:SAG22_NODE_284_length_13033_cov_21.541828_12_plen_137_part_00
MAKALATEQTDRGLFAWAVVRRLGGIDRAVPMTSEQQAGSLAGADAGAGSRGAGSAGTSRTLRSAGSRASPRSSTSTRRRPHSAAFEKHSSSHEQPKETTAEEEEALDRMLSGTNGNCVQIPPAASPASVPLSAGL